MKTVRKVGLRAMTIDGCRASVTERALGSRIRSRGVEINKCDTDDFRKGPCLSLDFSRANISGSDRRSGSAKDL